MKKRCKKWAAFLLSTVMIFMLSDCSCKNNQEQQELTLQEGFSTEALSTEALTAEEPSSKEEPSTEPSSAENEYENAPGAAVLDNYKNIFIVTAEDTLNVRQEPSADSAVIAVIAKNGAGEVVENTADGAWTHITSGGVDGYVSSQYIVTGEEAKKLAVENCTEGIRVTADLANIREQADKNSQVVSQAAAGTCFPCAGTEGEFYRIAINGTEAYIHDSCAETTWCLQEAVSENTVIDETGSEISGTPAAPGSTGLTVCIDAGHQQYGIAETEPNGPGSSVMKAKLTTGTQGCATGIPEYEINLQVSLKLQAELQARGYSVVMIRTTNDCPSSNAERAQTANNSGADIFVRIHCNSMDDQSISGVINYAPSPANPYMSSSIISGSNTLAQLLADGICSATGARNRGVLQDDSMTGINWCQIPVAIVEMGFMSNPAEDQLLADAGYQSRLASGMANGIDAYFGR